MLVGVRAEYSVEITLFYQWFPRYREKYAQKR